MEVRCLNCQTEYRFDRDRVGANGVTVKCTVCGHVFQITREGESKRTADAHNTGREWLVRHTDGRMVAFRELTTLQKWIVEGRIERADEISKTGHTWKQLGGINELEPFFSIYERAMAVERGSLSHNAPPMSMPSDLRASQVFRAVHPSEIDSRDAMAVPLTADLDAEAPTLEADIASVADLAARIKPLVTEPTPPLTDPMPVPIASESQIPVPELVSSDVEEPTLNNERLFSDVSLSGMTPSQPASFPLGELQFPKASMDLAPARTKPQAWWLLALVVMVLAIFGLMSVFWQPGSPQTAAPQSAAAAKPGSAGAAGSAAPDAPAAADKADAAYAKSGLPDVNESLKVAEDLELKDTQEALAKAVTQLELAHGQAQSDDRVTARHAMGVATYASLLDAPGERAQQLEVARALLVGPRRDSPDSRDTLRATANYNLVSGDFAELEKNLAKVQGGFDDDPDLLYLDARRQLGAEPQKATPKVRAAARSQLVRALELQPRLNRARVLLAELWMLDDDNTQADAELETILKDAPEHAGAKALLEKLHPSPEALAKAAKDAAQAEKAAAEAAEEEYATWMSRAKYYRRRDQVRRASVAFSKALEIRATSTAQLGLAWALYDLEQTRRALQAFRKVLRMNRNEYEAYYGIGACYDELEDADRAYNAYMEYLDLAPMDAPDRGVVLRRVKELR